MARIQEVKPDLTKSILYTLDEDKYSNNKVSILLEMMGKEHPNFILYSINRYRDKKHKCFIEILFEKQ